jgi:tetratricopeptide (TPR) repeat protein
MQNPHLFKNIMKLKFILLTLSLLCLQPLAAQEDYGQNLLDALYMRQYADALDYYDRHKDSIADRYLLVYKAITSVVLNKPDSAIAYLNILLNDTYPDSGGGAMVEDWFYDRLIRMYRYRGDYENAAKCYERLAARLAVRPYNTDSYAEYLRDLNNLSQRKSLFPTMTLLNTGETEDIRIKMQIAKHIITHEAQYNKTLLKIKTCFDTGGRDAYFTMGRRTADSIGVKVVVADSTPINDNETNSFRGVIDSIRMGNLLIRNAPVWVVLADTTPLDYDADDSTFTPLVVIGLPVIKRLNHIRLDMRNEEMVISLNRKDAATGRSNMFLDNANIYEKLLLTGRLNGARFTAFFDTGWGNYKRDSVAILVTRDFHQNHRNTFPNLEDNSVDSTAIRLLNNNVKINYIRVPESQLQIDGKLQTFHRDVVVLQDRYDVLVKNDDGLIGLEPLKRFKKVTLDFYNMRLELD